MKVLNKLLVSSIPLFYILVAHIHCGQNEKQTEIESKLSELSSEFANLKSSFSSETGKDYSLQNAIDEFGDELVNLQKDISTLFDKSSDIICTNLKETRNVFDTCKANIMSIQNDKEVEFKTAIENFVNLLVEIKDELSTQEGRPETKAIEDSLIELKKCSQLRNTIRELASDWVTKLNKIVCDNTQIWNSSINECTSGLKKLKGADQGTSNSAYSRLISSVEHHKDEAYRLQLALTKQGEVLTNQLKQSINNQRSEIYNLRAEVKAWVEPFCQQICRSLDPSVKKLQDCVSCFFVFHNDYSGLPNLIGKHYNRFYTQIGQERKETRDLMTIQSKEQSRSGKGLCNDLDNSIASLTNEIDFLNSQTKFKDKRIEELRNEVYDWFLEMSSQICEAERKQKNLINESQRYLVPRSAE